MTTRSPPVAVAFDMDGTLLDSLDATYEATVLALRDVVGPERAKGWRVEDARLHEGRAFEEIARLAAGADLGPLVVKRFRAIFPEVAARVVRPFDDVEHALDELAKEQTPLAVATNKPAPTALELLGRFGLARRFRAVLGAGGLRGRHVDGAHAWVIARDPKKVPPGADRVLGSLEEVPKLLREARAAKS